MSVECRPCRPPTGVPSPTRTRMKTVGERGGEQTAGSPAADGPQVRVHDGQQLHAVVKARRKERDETWRYRLQIHLPPRPSSAGAWSTNPRPAALPYPRGGASRSRVSRMTRDPPCGTAPSRPRGSRSRWISAPSAGAGAPRAPRRLPRRPRPLPPRHHRPNPRHPRATRRRNLPRVPPPPAPGPVGRLKDQPGAPAIASLLAATSSAPASPPTVSPPPESEPSSSPGGEDLSGSA